MRKTTPDGVKLSRDKVGEGTFGETRYNDNGGREKISSTESIKPDHDVAGSSLITPANRIEETALGNNSELKKHQPSVAARGLIGDKSPASLDHPVDKQLSNNLSTDLSTDLSTTPHSEGFDKGLVKSKKQNARESVYSNGNTALQQCVVAELEKYFAMLEGHPPNDLYKLVITQVETALFTHVLSVCGNNQSRAAEYLGVSRGTLRNRIVELSLD